MILDLKQQGKIPDEEIGGKAASLCSLLAMDAPVPPGIVVPDLEFRNFLWYNALNLNMHDLASGPEIKAGLQKISIDIQNGKMHPGFLAEVLKQLETLSISTSAVRSSANVEDAGQSSFAGVFKSYLNVIPAEIGQCIKKVWASAFDHHVHDYLQSKQLDFKDIKMGVVIQKMMNPEVSGVCFSINPVTKNLEEMIIEAVFGLGETLVSGEITPDTYIISKPMMSVKALYPTEQTKALTNTSSGTEMVTLPPEMASKKKLKEEHLMQICSITEKISTVRGHAIDVEFLIQESKLYIVQVRPITTLN